MNFQMKEDQKMKNEIVPSVLLNVLSLEDSENDFEIISEKLVSAGYNINISRVENESEFISLIRNNIFDIILADFNLPSFDAFDALKQCLIYCPQVPFICISGSIGEITAIELLKLGAVDYVLKDRLERLPFAVKRALDEVNSKKERRQAEIALEQSEEKFRNLFENHAAPKLIIEVDTGDIVDANLAAANFYGWKTDELTKMKIGEITTSTPEEIKDSIDLVLNHDKVKFEFHHRCKDGTIKDVEILSSKVVISGKEFFHSIIHDITDKKKAEEKVRLLSLTIDQSPESITITDTDAKIEYVNPAFCKITGYSFDEVKGKTPYIFNSGNFSKDDLLELSETVRSGKIWTGEFLNTKKNGELFWENVVISPLVNEFGQITHFVSVKEDITEKRKMIEDLIASKEKAEASDRLKTAFMNNISHEIRTPLNGILGFGQILIDEKLSPENRKQYLAILNQSSDRLINTVTNFMDISLINSGNQEVFKEEINLSSLINNLVRRFEEQTQMKNIRFSIEAPASGNEIIVNTDGELLNKIIYQLVDNAVKFTQKGTVTVGFRMLRGNLNLFVRDTGLGISEEKKNQIFDNFTQENISNTRGYEGSGIGLSIAKGFAELLGGNIHFESEKGKGSTFYLSLPCNQGTIDQ